MRQSYYDQKDWKDHPLPAAPERSQPEPYGPVPEQGGGLRSAGIVPAAQPSAPGLRTVPRRTTPAPAKGGDGRMRKFSLVLTLILLLTATGLILRGGLPTLRSPLEPVEDVWDWIGPGYEWDRYLGEEWADELENTTVERAPAGKDTALILSPARELSLAPGEIYDRVAPAVVGIRATLEDGVALGTGVVMSSDGYIITNAHVIAGASRVSVTLSDDSRKTALLAGYDGPTDLAVLKIDGKDLPTAEFGDSAALRVGDRAYAIGNPLGEELRGTMTDGIVSAIDRTVDMDGQEMTLIQTTAALNSGNSGGALVNAAGQVVGITNMKMMSEWETIEGLGFAIPTVQVKAVVDQIIAMGSYEGAPSIGVTVVTQSAAADTPAGVCVLEVEERSDAYAQGIRSGDVIVEANGIAIVSVQDLERAKAGLGVGDELRLVVWKGQGFREVTVKLVGRNRL